MPLTQHVRIGGPVIGGTNQSVVFVDSNGQLQQSAGLKWDDTNKYLTISNAGASRLQLLDTGSAAFPWYLETNNAAASLAFGRVLGSTVEQRFRFQISDIGFGDQAIVQQTLNQTVGGVSRWVFNSSSTMEMNFTPAEGGGTSRIAFGKRWNDSSAAVGAYCEFWPTTTQTEPTIASMEPGGATRRWGVMPNGDVQHYVVGSKIHWTGRAEILSPADGSIQLRDTAGTSFGRLQFGGTTSSYPAVKRSSAVLQVRLADDSAFAQLDALQVAIVDAVTAPSATAGLAKIFVDTADGELKVIFGDGEIRTITGTPVDYLAVLAGI